MMRRMLLVLQGTLVLLGAAVAQNPTSVDIDLVEGSTPGTLEVRVRPNGQGFSGIVSAVQFTISWPATSPATLGTRVQYCAAGFSLSSTPQVTASGTIFRTYSAFGFDPMSTTCPGEVWTAGVWHRIMTVPVNGNTGCTTFQIVSNAFGQPSDTNYFISLGGVSKTGIIEQTSVFIGSCAVPLAVKLHLEGPYDTGTLLMRDDLRAAGTVPSIEPYTALGYPNAASGGAETTTAGVLAVSGTDAIVDWVRIELRSSTDPTVLVATRHGLVQRDGDVVSAADGVSNVTIGNIPGSYYVVVRHRNHLGAMTATALALNLTATSIDYRNPATLTFGTDARKTIGAVMALWAGDVNSNGQLKYAGNGNDRDALLTAIGGTVPTNTVSGQYRQEDINLNGQVKYAGSANDRDLVLQVVGGTVPTATRSQVPVF